MRTKSLVFMMCVGIGLANAQVPRLVSYQGLYTDTTVVLDNAVLPPYDFTPSNLKPSVQIR